MKLRAGTRSWYLCEGKRSHFGHLFVPFEIKTPLTDTEVLYAVETTLALGNLAIIPVDDGSIRAGHISEQRKLIKDPSEGSRKP